MNAEDAIEVPKEGQRIQTRCTRCGYEFTWLATVGYYPKENISCHTCGAFTEHTSKPV